MKVALFSTNDTFFGPVQTAFEAKGHEVLRWRENHSGYDLGRLLSICDLAFVEFCQSPLDQVVSVIGNHPNVVLAARMHRIEMYNQMTANPDFPWDRVDCLFVSAEHVADRFIRQRNGMSKPKNIVIASTNVISPDRFKFVERVWKPPYRLCLLGNFVPKKRQYTTIQFMFDLKEKFGGLFKLDIVGMRGAWSGYGNPEYYQNCLDLIEELSLNDVVTIYDKIPHEQVPEFLAREHAIISNSNEEGTHVSIAEGAMTGCIPFVNCWRGSTGVYPREVAEHFRSPAEFTALCTGLKMRSEAGSIQKASKKIAEEARNRFGDLGKYRRMVEILERCVSERAVPTEEKK